MVTTYSSGIVSRHRSAVLSHIWWWQHTVVALFLGTEVQSSHTSDSNIPCRFIPYESVRAGHFSNFVWCKDLGGTFCSSVCKFLLEHAVWRPPGLTGLVMNRDVTLWCRVSVRWHRDESCWLNLKGQSLDPEDEGTTIFQDIIYSPDNTVSHAITLYPSVCHPCDDPKSHKCWLISPVRINTTCHIYFWTSATVPVPASVIVLLLSANKT